jgi:hypothetical protein
MINKTGHFTTKQFNHIDSTENVRLPSLCSNTSQRDIAIFSDRLKEGYEVRICVNSKYANSLGVEISRTTTVSRVISHTLSFRKKLHVPFGLKINFQGAPCSLSEISRIPLEYKFILFIQATCCPAMENKFQVMIFWLFNVIICTVSGLKMGADEHSSSNGTRLLSDLFVN